MPSPRPSSRSLCRHLLLLHLLLLLRAPGPARAARTSLPHTQRNLPSPALVKRLLVNTRYEIMDGHPHGCNHDISHLNDIDTNVSLPMLASVPFSSIKIGRSTCSKKHNDNRMKVYTAGYGIRAQENSAALPAAARNAVDMAGLDLSLRVCGKEEEAQALQYFFSQRFDDLYDYLVDRFLSKPDPKIVKSLQAVAAAAAAVANDGATITSDSYAEDSSSTDVDDETLLLMGNATYAWMVSTPQKYDESFRVCVYRAVIPKENSILSGNQLPKPTQSPSPSPVFTPEEEVDVSPSPEPVDEMPTSEPTPTPTSAVADTSATATPSPKRQSTFSDSTFDQATNSADGTDGGDSQKASAAACFPAHARVRVTAASECGVREVRMDQLKTGDDMVMGGEVFGFTHRDSWAWSEFVTLTTASNHTLTVSPGHYVYVAEQEPQHQEQQEQQRNRDTRRTPHAGELDTGRIGRATMTIRMKTGSATMIAARRMHAGMRLVTVDDGATTVVRVGRTWARGLYNPQTTDGSIVVDGVVVSTYTEAVAPRTAHALLAPLRAMFKWAGVAVSYGQGQSSGAEVDGLGLAVDRRWRPSASWSASTWSWRR